MNASSSCYHPIYSLLSVQDEKEKSSKGKITCKDKLYLCTVFNQE